MPHSSIQVDHTIAIIGAGLSGLTLALSLVYANHPAQKITIYESREAPLDIGGGVMLSPNALRILNTLGLYQPIQRLGYNFDELEFRTVEGDVIDTYEFGNEDKYGFSGNRVYRFELINVLLDAVRRVGVNVAWSRKFARVTKENEGKDVTFEFSDGTSTTAGLLVAADGIHSTVRKYMYPKVEPKFVGQAGITATVSASDLPVKQRITVPVTIMTKNHGAFVLAPQKVDGSELLIGKQKRIEGTPTREEWDNIHADKPAAIEFLRRDNEVFGDLAVAATHFIPEDKINIWPFFIVPKLDRWASASGRVVVVGDAAHAIPPSAGQGISQAMEDVFMLALMMGKVNSGSAGYKSIKEAMQYWQDFRQRRVAQVLELNSRVDQRRLPREEGTPQIKKEEWDLDWLYKVDIQRVVNDWATT